MKLRPIVLLAIAGACPAAAKDMLVPPNDTALWMIEQARAWAIQACGGKWVISEILAADFKGTSPKGGRYEKPAGEPPHDPKTQWSTNCSLDEADVRFFGTDVAVMYWLRRNGKWQIIAVQDNRIDCPAT
jgi:hypothetical protein